jgi:hypothetical protein
MQRIFKKFLLGADFSMVNRSHWVGLLASLVFLFWVVFNWQHTKHRQLPLLLKSVFFIGEKCNAIFYQLTILLLKRESSPH